jgi:anti-anti-sigma factor
MSCSLALVNGALRYSVDAELAASGELDFADVAGLEDALRGAQERSRGVTLDLQALTFMDCSILSVLLAAAARARHGGRRFLLISGSASVDRLLRLTATEPQFEITRPSSA